MVGFLPPMLRRVVTPFPDGGTGLPVSGRMHAPSVARDSVWFNSPEEVHIAKFLNKIDTYGASCGERDGAARRAPGGGAPSLVVLLAGPSSRA